jgi:hypothetical protein
MKYKIIFFDLDGTLLTDNKTILDENKKEIKRVNELEIETVICTGRQINAVQYFKDMAGTGRFVICTNGAEIYDYKENKIVYSSLINNEVVKQLHKIADEEECLIKIDTLNERYINKMKYSQVGEIELTQSIESLLINEKILQISIGNNNRDKLDKIVEKIKQIDEVKVENYFYFKDEIWIINIVNKEVSKGNGIRKLCQYLNIDTKEVVAFGDDINDISMLNAVGYGIAMGNSNDKLKKIAKKITTYNEENGIAKELQKLIKE